MLAGPCNMLSQRRYGLVVYIGFIQGLYGVYRGFIEGLCRVYMGFM